MKEKMTRNTNAVLSKVHINSDNITQIQNDNIIRDSKFAELERQFNFLKEDKTNDVVNVNNVNTSNQQQNLTNHATNQQVSNDTISKEKGAANGMVWNVDKS